jgi:hypothetical protein
MAQTEYQITMKLRHAKNRLEAARKREAKASKLYNRRVRETEQADHQYRQARHEFESRNMSEVVNAALSLWDGRSCVGK